MVKKNRVRRLSGKLTAEQQQLAAQWLPYAIKKAREHSQWGPLRGYDLYDDLFSAGQFACCNAALNFDPSLGFKFSTYVCNSINREIRKEAAKRLGATLPKCIGIMNDGSSDLPNFVEHEPAKDESIEESDDSDTVRMLMKSLRPLDKFIIECYYYKGLKHRQIAELLNVQRQYIHQLLHKALKRMREMNIRLQVKEGRQ